ncbi:hypothetical protein HZ994_16730 [Akkermansiaceae bacterium]|nr:hypothetical protein HZ994_16730 [Akkermansiaceae bacterium]
MPGNSGNKPPAWLWPNLLGLDAPAVAVSWQVLFSCSFDADFPAVLHLILGLSVWCIYLADRLCDSVRAGETAGVTDRLMFTRRNFKALAIALAFAAGANLLLIARHVPGKLIVPGLLTATLLAAYYLLRFMNGARFTAVIPREILCGMLYALGCVIATNACAPSGSTGAPFWFAAFLLGLVCSANCMLISLWEHREDLAACDRSIATTHPRILGTIAAAVSSLTVISLAATPFLPWRICISVALSALALRVILNRETRLPTPMLRVLADAALLTPLAFLWG